MSASIWHNAVFPLACLSLENFVFQALKSPPVYEVIDTRRDITEYLTLDQVMNKLSVLETVQVV